MAEVIQLGLVPLEQVALQAAQEYQLNRLFQEMEQRFAARLDLVSQRTRIDNNKHCISGIDYILHGIDQHSFEVNQHIAVIDGGLDEANQGFDEAGRRFNNVDLALAGVNRRMDSIQAALAIIERISHARTFKLNASITQDTAELMPITLGNGRIPDRDLNRIPATFGQLKMMAEPWEIKLRDLYPEIKAFEQEDPGMLSMVVKRCEQEEVQSRLARFEHAKRLQRKSMNAVLLLVQFAVAFIVFVYMAVRRGPKTGFGNKRVG